MGGQETHFVGCFQSSSAFTSECIAKEPEQI